MPASVARTAICSAPLEWPSRPGLPTRNLSRRPSFSDAAPAEMARGLFQYYCARLAQYGIQVEQGVFQATMSVALVNEGPVTLMLDSNRGRGVPPVP